MNKNILDTVRNISIKNLFGIYNIEWHLKNDVSVLVGDNGTGKSTILKIIMWLLADRDYDIRELFEAAEIQFNNGRKVSAETIFLKNNNQIDTFKKLINKAISKSKATEIEEIEKIIDSLIKNGSSLKPIKIIHNEKDIEDFGDPINFEYISTINMSANSINIVKSSDGKTTTILDMEIEREISKFNILYNNNNDSHSKSTVEKFFRTINTLLSDSQKTAIYNEESIKFESRKNNQIFDFKKLSSGERQLLYILLKSANCADKFSIILMDEPEISLHLKWQESLISNIKEINPSCQLIIVTHSPAMVMSGWMDSFTDITEIRKES